MLAIKLDNRQHRLRSLLQIILSDRSSFRYNVRWLPVIPKRSSYDDKARCDSVCRTIFSTKTTWEWQDVSIRFFKYEYAALTDLTKTVGTDPFAAVGACSNLLQIGCGFVLKLWRWMLLPCFASEPTSAESSVWQVRKWSGSLVISCLYIATTKRARKTGFKLT